MRISKLLIMASLVMLFASCTSTSVKPYTSQDCIVSDNELGSMGDPISMVHEGQEVKFCCKPCIKKFKKNPEKYLKKLN